MVGRVGFEPTKAYASCFTDSPVWPLRYLPLSYLAARRIRTDDLLFTRQLLYH